MVLEMAEFEERHAELLIEVGEEVDVGLWSCFASGDRAEEAQMDESRRLKFGGVAAKDFENAVPVHLVKSLAYVAVQYEGVGIQRTHISKKPRYGAPMWW
jgi:hypothetical protein